MVNKSLDSRLCHRPSACSKKAAIPRNRGRESGRVFRSGQAFRALIRDDSRDSLRATVLRCRTPQLAPRISSG